MPYKQPAEERLKLIDLKIEDLQSILNELKKNKQENLRRLTKKEHQLLQNKIKRAGIKRDLKKADRTKRAHRLIQIGAEIDKYIKVLDFQSDEEWGNFIYEWKKYVERYSRAIERLKKD